MPSVVTFAQLPEEEAEFLAYLSKTGDVWARWVSDDPHEPKCEPGPVAEFLERYEHDIIAYHCVDLYIGLRDDVENPELTTYQTIEGGIEVPVERDGRILPGVHRIEGGRTVEIATVDDWASSLIHYRSGRYRDDDDLAMSNLSFYSGVYRGDAWHNKPPAFLKWAKNVLAWMRRHTKDTVQEHRRNSRCRATVGVVDASSHGLKVY